MLRSAIVTLSILAGCGGGEEIHIAYVGPLSGPDANAGRAAVRGIQVYLNELEKSGVKVKLDSYDDQNDPSLAKTMAERIADSKAVAVIGHHAAPCSLAGAEIYRARGIPAVTAVTTDAALTKEPGWYFRTIYNDDALGIFLAHYLEHLTHAESIAVVHTVDGSDARVARSLIDEWQKQPGRTALAIPESTPPEAIAESVIARDAPVVLALSGPSAAKLVARFRAASFSQKIVGTNALEQQSFLTAFDDDPRERANPGQLTNGIYVAVPFLFDIGDERAAAFRRNFGDAYGDLPGWIEAFSHDAAMLIVESLREVGEGDVAERRKLLRDAIASRRSNERAIRGVTGATFLNENGDPPKPVAMGMLRGRSTEVALLQLRSTPTGFAPIDIVLTGVRVNRIFDVHLDKGHFKGDCFVWLRHRSDLDAEQLMITNAVGDAPFGDPIAMQEENGVKYVAYRITPKLAPDYFPTRYGENVMGISYRHKTLTRDRLIFARDSIGMGVQTAQTNEERLRQIERLLDPSFGFAVQRVVFFEDTAVEHSIGDPHYLERARKTIDYSRYNIGLAIAPSALTLRRSLPQPIAAWVFPVSLVCLLLLLIGGRYELFASFSRTRLVLQVLATTALLISAEIYLGELLLRTTGRRYEKATKMFFDMSWWAAPALLINAAIRSFVWQPLEEQTERAVPTILRLFVSFTVYLLAFFGVIAFVFDQKLTSLLATSGVFTMIIGLAIQINIANIFSGIALNLERPFRIGDWIMIHASNASTDGGLIGCVTDINWRTTRLMTTSNTIVIIPNGQISEKTITNFMIPTEVSRFELIFVIDGSVPPDDVLKILRRSVQKTIGLHDGPLAEPEFKVRIDGTTELGVAYSVRYYIVPREVSPSKARHRITESVLEQLRAANMTLSNPKRDITFKKVEGPPFDVDSL